MHKQKIQQAAESIIYLFKDNEKRISFIAKERIPKGYRIKQIDKKLRKERTKTEANIMRKAMRAGILTPKIIKVLDFEIDMEYINGKKIKDLFLKTDDKNLVKKICETIGKYVATLHDYGIIHGDLTTSNMIVINEPQFRLYFIDFGLAFHSQKTEDKAVDLHLLYQALQSTHFKILDFCWSVIIDSYKNNSSKAGEVLKRLHQIEKRGRYKER